MDYIGATRSAHTSVWAMGVSSAEFITRYRAIVFKPFKGEVVDGVVHNLTRMRTLYPIISCPRLSVRYAFHAISDPPSLQLLHPALKFEPSSNPPSYTSQDHVIENNTKIRIKIIGTRVDATEIFAIGTIKENHLGVIE
ncbi:hypothetical protein EDB92DRAFT_1952119 [Lactarius akahatsu]|uniref:Uncharacterized protein n=1 Tax=Lactarius akahatsu TaxID=416441 RepID=A0AAD4L8M5_9AGAM|nr:hypothetical protein EDB92DRAFT_1952119 [Lactarius akahatsu]